MYIMRSYNMKTNLVILFVIMLGISCGHTIDKETTKKMIFDTEKDFEKMAAEKGVAEAFYYFADDSAVINRGNDSLIKGREAIKNYYKRNRKDGATVNWTPDFVDVSDCGTLGYTYGRYTWKIKDSADKEIVYKGIFHTVWKKQKDNTWRYVWD
jgi:ketosteroid isomerase-like protein